MSAHRLRRPPAVQVRCRGPGDWRRIESVIRAAAAGSLLAWSGSWLGWGASATASAAAGAMLVVWVSGARQARREATAELRWNGSGWSIIAGAANHEIPLESVHVQIDLGRTLLLRAVGPGVAPAVRWWWIRAGAPRGVPIPEFRDLCTALYAQRSGVVPPEPR